MEFLVGDFPRPNPVPGAGVAAGSGVVHGGGQPCPVATGAVCAIDDLHRGGRRGAGDTRADADVVGRRRHGGRVLELAEADRGGGRQDRVGGARSAQIVRDLEAEAADETVLEGLHDQAWLAHHPTRLKLVGQLVVAVHCVHLQFDSVHPVVAMAVGDQVELVALEVAGVMGALREPASVAVPAWRDEGVVLKDVRVVALELDILEDDVRIADQVHPQLLLEDGGLSEMAVGAGEAEVLEGALGRFVTILPRRRQIVVGVGMG